MYLTNNWTIFYLSNLEVQLSKYVVSFIWGELRFWMVPYHLTFFGVFLRFEHFFSLVSCGAVSYTKISNQWHRRGLWCICAPTSPGLLNNYLCIRPTVVCIKVHKIASVWCKTALGEVGVSLPWWCHPLFLLAPGYWSQFLGLKNWSKLKFWNFSIFTLWNSKFQLWPMEKWPLVIFPL